MDKERLHKLITALQKPVFVYQMSYTQTRPNYPLERRVGAQKRVDAAAEVIESLIEEYVAGGYIAMVRWCLKHDRLASGCDHQWETGQIEYRDSRIMQVDNPSIADFYHGG